MKKIILFLAVVFIIGMVFAESEICVDFDAPSAPSNLALSASGNDISLSWTSATDEPNCSGIANYEIHKDGVLLGTSSVNSYSDKNVSYGTYEYSVYAVDKAGHTGSGISKTITLSPPINTNSNGGNSGGGNGGSAGLQVNKNETNESSSEFSSLSNEDGNSKLPTDENQESTNSGKVGGGITGAFGGFVGSRNGQGILLGALVVIIAIGILGFRKRKSKSSSGNEE